MQPLRPKPVIFVAVRDLTLIVSGKTRQKFKALGFEGMHFKWDRDRQHWYGPLSCKNLEALGPAGLGRITGGREETAGILRERG